MIKIINLLNPKNLFLNFIIENKNKNKKKEQMGFEPTTNGLKVQCANRCAITP
jgi:hypothetical protein